MMTQVRPVLRFTTLAALVLLVAACGREKTSGNGENDAPAVHVRTANATAAATVRYQDATGTVVATDRARIAPKIMGTIARVPVALGQKVSKGELLIEISAREIEARLAQARSALAQTERDLKRETELVAQGASAADTVRTLEDQHRQMLAVVDEAESMLGYTRILAPFDGTVSRRPAFEGDLATPGVTVIEMDGTDRMRVEAGVPESLANLTLGSSLRVSAGTAEVTGILAEISSAADPQTRTVLAKIDLPADSGLKPGQFVSVAIPAGEASPVVVPASAVSRVGQIERVFVIESGRAVLRIIRTGALSSDTAEITAGLDAGEVVALGGVTLRDGQRVEVAP
ncbi:MAG TPA: efflux RND transporter periplasmic adaptor subunit [Opitutaceae bacterium]|nr:efflux RND transporter periplasmic adaptor subunit [Opitutaceae bacterium]